MDTKKTLYRVLNFSIVIFWVVMIGILLGREIFFKNKTTGYQPFLSKNTLLRDQWMGIYFKESPVGFVHTSLEPYMITKGLSGYRIINRTFMNFLLLRKRHKVWFDASAIVDEDYQLVSFESELNSGLHRIRVAGEVLDKKVMELKIESQGLITKKRIVLPREGHVIIASILSPFNAFGKLKTGARYNLKVFNPFSLEFEPLEIEVTGKDTIEHQGKTEEVFVVESDYRGLKQTAWVNDRGEILKEETVLGWVLIKEDADVASRVYKNMAKTDTELADLVSIISNVTLSKEDLNYLKIVLSGIGDEFSLSTQRQKVVKIDKPKDIKVIEINKDSVDEEQLLTIPIKLFKEFQMKSAFVQSDDERIRKLAKDIIKGEKMSFQAAKKINQWLFENIRKVPVVSIPSAIDVLKTREGDCNEHAVLFTALTRSVGIPTKINVGLTYTEGRFYYHAWPSVYVGQWVDMDPAFGQDIADVTHIKFIEGDLNKQLDIIKLLGKIKLEVIGYK